MTVLHLESFENNLFELDFSKKCISTVKTSEEDEIFCTVSNVLFRDSHSFSYIKTLLRVSDPLFEKNLRRVNKLKRVYLSGPLSDFNDLSIKIKVGTCFIQNQRKFENQTIGFCSTVYQTSGVLFGIPGIWFAIEKTKDTTTVSWNFLLEPK